MENLLRFFENTVHLCSSYPFSQRINLLRLLMRDGYGCLLYNL